MTFDLFFQFETEDNLVQISSLTDRGKEFIQEKAGSSMAVGIGVERTFAAEAIRQAQACGLVVTSD